MNPSDCDRLDDYLAGALDDRERSEFEAHLAACPACREESLAQAELDRLLRAAAETLEVAPAELPAEIQRRLAAAASRRRRSLAAAALIAVVALSAASWGWHVVRDGGVVARPQPERRDPKGRDAEQRILEKRIAEQKITEQRQINADAHEAGRRQDESETVNAAEAAVSAPAARAQIASSPEMIAAPIKSENPNVTIFWLYPTVKSAGR